MIEGCGGLACRQPLMAITHSILGFKYCASPTERLVAPVTYLWFRAVDDNLRRLRARIAPP